MEECQLYPGDVLALYTDGITEACNEAGEEFGEDSLLEELRRYRDSPCQTALHSIADDVCKFSPLEQQDDITLIVAKCRWA